MLNGVPATSDQMNSMLDQLTTGLSNTTELLNRTKDALGAVENKLNTLQTDLNAITSSATYQKLLSLEGIDADSIASFMSSPVEINTETYYAVDNYGSSMTPFYSNLAIWVGGIVLIAIFKMEVDKDSSMAMDRQHYILAAGSYIWLLVLFRDSLSALVIHSFREFNVIIHHNLS